jgi:hypothetical protein
MAKAINPSFHPANGGNDAISTTYDELYTIAEPKTQSGDCVAGIGSITSKTTKSCPFEYTLTKNSLSYVINSAAYYALNDIIGISLALTTTGNLVQGHGTFTSQTLGNIAITVTGSTNTDPDSNNSVTMNYTMQFPGFTTTYTTHEVSGPTSQATELFIDNILLTTDEANFVLLPKLQPTSL